MKKMILLQIEFAEKEIRETENIIRSRIKQDGLSVLKSINIQRMLAKLNHFRGYREAMQICLRELEERENSELEKMYEEQNNI